jgi:hypothetical protein
MNLSVDQILPSLQALGVSGYWLIGLASMLEAFFLTGVVIPGTLIVDAGGILVQHGLWDSFDLAWFVAIGSAPPTPCLLFDAVYAAIEGNEDATVETVPHFWRGQPNELVFVQHGTDGKPALNDPKAHRPYAQTNLCWTASSESCRSGSRFPTPRLTCISNRRLAKSQG